MVVILGKIRTTLSILNKEWIDGKVEEGESAIVEKLQANQNLLRHNGNHGLLETHKVVEPFLMMLRSEALPGPFKLVALDAIQTFITHDVLLEGGSQTEYALAEIIEALVNCSLVSLSSDDSDGMVHLQILHNVDCIIKSATKSYLRDDMTWSLVKLVHEMSTQAGVWGKSALYQSASHIMEALLGMVFRQKKLLEDNGMIVDDESDCLLHGQLSTIIALKIVKFYMDIIGEQASKDATTVLPPGRFAPGTSSGISARSGIKNSSNSGDALETDTVELLLALKAIQTIVLVDGNKGLCAARGGGHLMLRPVFSHYFRDDLGRCLVMLAGKQRFPVAVMSAVLDIFTSILSTYGPVMRVVVENFMRHVFLKALYQTLRLFGEQDIFLNGQNEEGLSDGYAGALTPTSKDLSRDGDAGSFSVPKLELILQNLVDLLADFDFVPSIFASFDCDTTKNDVVQPMVRYLSRCVRYTLANNRNGAYDLGPLTDISAVCLSCYKSLLSSLSDRCTLREGSKDTLTSSKQVELVSRIYRAARARKEVMAQAARIFSTRKPSDAFRFLQDHAILKSPAPTKDVAEFLRYTPGLNIEKVGSYLGELGKDDSVVARESDGMEFHKAVLTDYIALFDFRDLSILQAIRIFLSAFLLPKEAQQIERIFVALSEHCHRSCVECVSGAFENSDVTYLMTMSIIMLNTDRHNPNIRPERKMSRDKFVKVNTHYGRDVRQTKAVDPEYLEAIYDEIGVRPLRTEPDDLSSGITAEMWTEKQLQLKRHPEKGFLLGLSASAEALRVMSSGFCETFDETEGALVAAADKGFISPHATAHALNPLALSACIVGHCWLFDADYVACVWPEILGAGICPFLMPQLPPYIPDRLHPEVWFSREGTPRILRAGIDVLMALLKAADAHSVRHVSDVVVAVLVEITGINGYAVSEALFSKLKLGFHLSSSRGHDGTAASRNAALVREKSKGVALGFTTHLLGSLEARAALITLLQVVHNPAGYVKDRWAVVWFVLGRLRDCVLLPAAMVCSDGADEALPALVRGDFEGRLAAYELAALNKKRGTQQRNRRGLMGFLFGSSDSLPDKGGDDKGRGREGTSGNDQEASLRDGEKADPSLALATRWDAGYDSVLDLAPAPAASHDGPVDLLFSEGTSGASDALAPELAGMGSEESAALGLLRSLVSACGVASLVAESKYFSDDILLGFVRALSAQTAEAEAEAEAKAERGSDAAGQSPAGGTLISARDGAQSPTQCLPLSTDDVIGNILSCEVPLPSPASAAWQENVLVDVALRNRDRFSLLWPVLREHYLRGLNSRRQLTYVVERRVVAIFKIAERMLSRGEHTKAILSLLASLFVVPQAASFRGSVQPGASPLKPSLLRDVSGQVSTGLWRVVTRNVESLPRLGMEQWQILFDIISFCAGAGGYASIKAFETMAWLLHEPRLRAEVPVFCVVGIRPLLCSTGVPRIVSVGAVKLLTHLHMRLEVLVKDGGGGGAERKRGQREGHPQPQELGDRGRRDVRHLDEQRGAEQRGWQQRDEDAEPQLTDMAHTHAHAHTCTHTCTGHTRACPTGWQIDGYG